MQQEAQKAAPKPLASSRSEKASADALVQQNRPRSRR